MSGETMRIRVNRFSSTDDATLSIITINGIFECFGLEDEYRLKKVAQETRIPAGIYKVEVRDFGGKDAKYRKRFPSMHQGMLWVRDVPNFEHVLIHIGNWEKDTAGCLLVGKGCMSGDDYSLSSSRQAYLELYQKVITSALNGTLFIEYVDNDIERLVE